MREQLPMGQSYTFRKGPPPKRRSGRRKVLITGASGRIGSCFARLEGSRYDLTLMIRPGSRPDRALAKLGRVVECELADLAGLQAACRGIDTVLHLAGNPHPDATWEELLEPNVLGIYNVLAAAKSAGCRRVVFASSIHAISGYPPDVQARTSEAVNPGDLYGATKCFGEALGRYFSGQEGLSFIAVRIGAFQSLAEARAAESVPLMDSFVSERDLCQLLAKCIDDERLQFAIFHGVSDNRFKRMDISDARELLSYAPQDDMTAENPRLKPLRLAEKIPDHDASDTK